MTDPSKSRRFARELAFQALYSIKVGGNRASEAIDYLLERHNLSDQTEQFFRDLVVGVSTRVPELDRVVSRFLARGWSVDRLAITDLLALRMAAFEVHHLPGMPPKVTITQAVELAKNFGGPDSGRFVHGVLASIIADSDKAEWDPSREEKPEFLDDEPLPPVEEAEEEEEDQPETARFQVGAWTVKSDSP